MDTILYYLGLIATIIGVLIVIGVPLYFVSARAQRRKLDVAFAGREPLDGPTFYERFFRTQNIPVEIVMTVRRILEEEIGVDLSRLHADDDFTGNIRFLLESDGLIGVEIVMRLEAEFKIKIDDAEAESAHTVRDIVELVWRKLQATGQASPSDYSPQGWR
ncbi:MAG: acyl carrier protein [Pyrinomonadaceae bacterium]